jgi:hypothetical protein
MRARIHTIIVEELYMLAIRRSKLSHIYDQPFSFPNYIRYFALLNYLFFYCALKYTSCVNT